MEREEYDSRLAAIAGHPLMSKAWEVSVEPGWLGIVEDMLAEIAALPKRKRTLFSQVKEKFGGLRLYTVDSRSDAKHAGGGKDPREEAMIVVARAEAKAARSCQFCGAKGHIRNVRGWSMCLCEGHWRMANTPAWPSLSFAERTALGEPEPRRTIGIDLSQTSDGFALTVGEDRSTFGAGWRDREAAALNVLLDGEDVTVPSEETLRLLDDTFFVREARLFDVRVGR